MHPFRLDRRRSLMCLYKAVHRLCSTAILQLYAYSVSLFGLYFRYSDPAPHLSQDEWTLVWDGRPRLLIPTALYVIVGVEHLLRVS